MKPYVIATVITLVLSQAAANESPPHECYSFHAGTHGFACDSVFNSEVALANGTIVYAKNREDADLWRVMKERPGDFGFVTKIDIGRYHDLCLGQNRRGGADPARAQLAIPSSSFDLLIQIQPVTRSMVAPGVERGINVLELERTVVEGLILLWLFATTFDTAENQEVILPLLFELRRNINQYADSDGMRKN
ncbi:hypothetical protein LZ31DRAFT_600217 [Colletotrichum somersetense]|nr:hypothetical protein LZ31DRAFT_600217 [Colletotrichum somersetense]